MTNDGRPIPEAERLEAVARRVIADLLAYARRYAMRPGAHACRGFDEKLTCVECGRSGARPPDVITIFVGTLGQWWVNASGGGLPLDYVPAATVLPVLRAYLAQNAKLRAGRDRDGYGWLAAQDRSVEAAVEQALFGSPAPVDEVTKAPGDMEGVREVADAVWAVAKGLGVSDVSRRLKGLASRLHELESERRLENAERGERE